MTSAFIIQVHSQLQPDPNEETAALLRVLIHKIDNTTFGGDVPALPQWTGPPRTATQVQCILYTSLAASLLSAFLAMLGKQWLNRYASIDMRGSAIERSQNRQRKLDGIVTWYFDHVLESLPLMLQGALLLLGCALSWYLWDINTTVAWVVLVVTSFGALSYLFIAIAGATSASCPYQTPGANVIRTAIHHIRRVIHHIPELLLSAYTLFVEHSAIHSVSVACWRDIAKHTAKDIIIATLFYPLALLITFAIDVFHLGRATFWILVDFARRARNWFFSFARRAHSWLFGTSPVPAQPLDNKATKLDFHCISWMLRTSLDKTINLLTFNFLKTILALPGLNSSTSTLLVVDCFDIFSNCFVTSDSVTTTVTRGSEQLAGVSAMCFLLTFSRLSSEEPTSTTIRDVRQRYRRVFPSRVNLQGLPCPIIMGAIHSLLARPRERPDIDWRRYNPSFDELVPFSHALAHAAQFEYRRGGDESVLPDWLAAFAFHFLSQDPLPPTLVVLNCLKIIATGLGCNVSDNRVASDERCVHTPATIVSPLIPHQCAAWATFCCDNSEI